MAFFVIQRPEYVPFDTIDSVLRLANKYEFEQYHSWALSHLQKYPNSSQSVDTVYDHPTWKAYFRDPHFCIRMIRLTEILNRRDLDGLEYLAYFALSVINWKVHSQGEAFQGLEKHINDRLMRGHRQRVRCHVSRVLGVMDTIRKGRQKCADSAAGGLCIHMEDLFQTVILPSLNEDVIKTLRDLTLSSCGVRQQYIPYMQRLLFIEIRKHFRSEAPVAPEVGAYHIFAVVDCLSDLCRTHRYLIQAPGSSLFRASCWVRTSYVLLLHRYNGPSGLTCLAFHTY